MSDMYNYIRKNTSTNLISPELFDRELDGALIPGQWRNEMNEVTFAPIAAFPRRSSNNAKEIRLHLAEHFITNGSIPGVAKLNHYA